MDKADHFLDPSRSIFVCPFGEEAGAVLRRGGRDSRRRRQRLADAVLRHRVLVDGSARLRASLYRKRQPYKNIPRASAKRTIFDGRVRAAVKKLWGKAAVDGLLQGLFFCLLGEFVISKQMAELPYTLPLWAAAPFLPSSTRCLS